MLTNFQLLLDMFRNIQLYSKFFITFGIIYIVIYIILAILIGLEIIKWPDNIEILSNSGPLRERYMCSVCVFFVPIFLYAIYNYLTKENDLSHLIKTFTENGALGWGFLIFFGAIILFQIALLIYLITRVFGIWYSFIKRNNIGVILIILFDLLFPLAGLLFFLSDPMNNLVFVFLIYGLLFVFCLVSSEGIGGSGRSATEDDEAYKIITQNIFENEWERNKFDYMEGNISEEVYKKRRDGLLNSSEFDDFDLLDKLIYMSDDESQ